MTVKEAFKAIADAIRKRDGLDETVTYRPSDMPDAILNGKSKTITNQQLLTGLINRNIEVLDFGSITNIPDGGMINAGAKKVSGKNVLRVGDYGFYYDPDPQTLSTVLTEFDFPELTQIGAYAFANNVELIGTLGDKIKSIGEGAFQGDIGLTWTKLPDSVIELGPSTFSNCTNLKLTSLPSGITEVPELCFENCSSINTFEMGDTIASLGDSAFSGCSIANITFPTSIKEIPENCFENNENDTPGAYTFNEGLETIKANAFLNDTAVQEFNFSSTVNTIEESAFNGCSNVTNIVFGSGLKSIGDSALANCTNLTRVEFQDGVETLGANIFSGDSNLTDVIRIKSSTSGLYGITSVKNASLQTGTTEIAGQMFYNCTNLETVSGCELVTSIKANAFQSCTSLKSIDIDWNNLTNLEEYAFYSCGSLKIAKLSTKLVSIPSDAFYQCYLLTARDIPKLVNQIGDYAFYGCTGLQSIRIHAKTMQSLSRSAFSSCTNLKDIYVPWKSGAVSNAPWGASNATVHYETEYKTSELGSIDLDNISCKEDVYTGTVVAKVSYFDADEIETDILPDDANVIWSISGSDNATINASTGEINFTSIPAGSTVTVTATSEKYKSVSKDITIQKKYYSINLNDGQWVDSEATIGNYTVYRSDAGSYHVNNGKSLAIITLKGYSKFVVYIRSYAESSYDYVAAFPLDTDAVRGNTTVQTTSGKQSSTEYYKAEYTIPDSDEHTIQILYSKDSSGDSSDDRGYFYIAEDECE